MQVTQLGGYQSGLCYYLQFGCYNFLLDCGISYIPTPFLDTKECITTYKFQLPSFKDVCVESLDIILVSNPFNMLALPFLIEKLGFKGKVYATALSIELSHYLLLDLVENSNCLFQNPMYQQASPVSTEQEEYIKMPLRLTDIPTFLSKIQPLEYQERIILPYNIMFMPLSSGYSFGSCLWVLSSPEPTEHKLAYVPASSGDLIRGPSELNFNALCDFQCDTLLLTDLKPQRGIANGTEDMINQFLNIMRNIIERDGIMIVPTTPCGILFDLIDAIDDFSHKIRQTQQAHDTNDIKLIKIPLYFYMNDYDRGIEVIDLMDLGPEWLCNKKREATYTGINAFAGVKEKIQVISHNSREEISKISSGSVVFLGHSSPSFGGSVDIIRHFGTDSKNALVIVEDYFIDAEHSITSFSDLALEKIISPIDARLSCSNANQFIPRCRPYNLLIPEDVTHTQDNQSMDSNNASTSSHFSRVLPLSTLLQSGGKNALSTVEMKPLKPVTLCKPSKYVECLLDPVLAAKTTMSSVGGMAVSSINGTLCLKRKSFLLGPPHLPGKKHSKRMTNEEVGTAKNDLLSSHMTDHSSIVPDDQVVKWLVSDDGNDTVNSTSQIPVATWAKLQDSFVEDNRAIYIEKKEILVGQIDENRFVQAMKEHDENIPVYISDSTSTGATIISIPALEATITLWKEAEKTLIETPTEEARQLLTGFILAQLTIL